jgi:hypothetical protein
MLFLFVLNLMDDPCPNPIEIALGPDVSDVTLIAWEVVKWGRLSFHGNGTIKSEWGGAVELHCLTLTNAQVVFDSSLSVDVRLSLINSTLKGTKGNTFAFPNSSIALQPWGVDIPLDLREVDQSKMTSFGIDFNGEWLDARELEKTPMILVPDLEPSVCEESVKRYSKPDVFYSIDCKKNGKKSDLVTKWSYSGADPNCKRCVWYDLGESISKKTKVASDKNPVYLLGNGIIVPNSGTNISLNDVHVPQYADVLAEGLEIKNKLILSGRLGAAGGSRISFGSSSISIDLFRKVRPHLDLGSEKDLGSPSSLKVNLCSSDLVACIEHQDLPLSIVSFPEGESKLCEEWIGKISWDHGGYAGAKCVSEKGKVSLDIVAGKAGRPSAYHNFVWLGYNISDVKEVRAGNPLTLLGRTGIKMSGHSGDLNIGETRADYLSSGRNSQTVGGYQPIHSNELFAVNGVSVDTLSLYGSTLHIPEGQVIHGDKLELWAADGATPLLKFHGPIPADVKPLKTRAYLNEIDWSDPTGIKIKLIEGLDARCPDWIEQMWPVEVLKLECEGDSHGGHSLFAKWGPRKDPGMYVYLGNDISKVHKLEKPDNFLLGNGTIEGTGVYSITMLHNTNVISRGVSVQSILTMWGGSFKAEKGHGPVYNDQSTFVLYGSLNTIPVIDVHEVGSADNVIPGSVQLWLTRLDLTLPEIRALHHELVIGLSEKVCKGWIESTFLDLGHYFDLSCESEKGGKHSLVVSARKDVPWPIYTPFPTPSLSPAPSGSPAPSRSPSPSSRPAKHLSTGATVGISVGCFVGGGLIIGVICGCLRRRQSDSNVTPLGLETQGLLGK